MSYGGVLGLLSGLFRCRPPPSTATGAGPKPAPRPACARRSPSARLCGWGVWGECVRVGGEVVLFGGDPSLRERKTQLSEIIHCPHSIEWSTEGAEQSARLDHASTANGLAEHRLRLKGKLLERGPRPTKIRPRCSAGPALFMGRLGHPSARPSPRLAFLIHRKLPRW